MRETQGEIERGAGMVEYVILVAFIGVALVIAVGFLTGKLDIIFHNAGSAIPQ